MFIRKFETKGALPYAVSQAQVHVLLIQTVAQMCALIIYVVFTAKPVKWEAARQRLV